MKKENYLVAIDLGSSSVVVAVGCVADGRLKVVDFARNEVKGVVGGEIMNIEHVAAAIKETVGEVEQRLGVKIMDAYTGISGRHIKCANYPYYVFVGGDGEVKEEAVRRLNDGMRNMQAPIGESILDRIPQNYIIDGKGEEVSDPVGMFGRKLESTFSFVLGSNTPIERLNKALTRVELKQGRIFVNALASAEAVTLPDEREQGVAVVDIGAGTTDICIYHNDIVRYVGVIPLGADAINKDIRAYSIMDKYIEDLKIKFGYAVPDKAPNQKILLPGRTSKETKEVLVRNLSRIIEQRLVDIAEYVRKEIADAGYEGKLGLGLVLTGGCANLKDIDLFFKQYTGLDVRIAAPDVECAEGLERRMDDPCFATAAGLLLKAQATGRMSHVEEMRTISGVAAEPEQEPEPEEAAAPQPEGESWDSEPEPEEEERKSAPAAASRHKAAKPGITDRLKNWMNNIVSGFEVIDESNEKI